ncbi:MAG: histidine kinase N-terminal 7TM domain-containing protein, partial [Patescibacteria group bacterium]
MTFFAISALINAITSSILGFFVIYKKRSRLNINFSLFCLSVAFWSFSYFLWQISNNEASAILWSKILTIGSILIPLFYLRFTLVFLDLDKERFHKILLKFGYFLAFFFLVISPTSLLVDGVSKKLEFQFWPNPGSLYWLFLLMFISFASYSVILFFKFNGKVLGVKRGQIKFLLLGTGLGFLGGSTNFLLWYDIPIPPYGNVLVAFYVFFTTYAIIAHHLMDIKLVIRKSSVYLLSILTIILFVVAINYNIINEPVTGFSVFADLGILILAILIFPYIKNYFYRFANKYFFSSLYDSREVIGDISDKLRTTLEAQKIYEYIHNSLDNAFHFKSFAIL